MILIPDGGNLDSDVMLVGEAPGGSDEALRQNFTGASGQELCNLMLEAGMNISQCYQTNVCKYRPPNNDITRYILKIKKKGVYPSDYLNIKNKMVHSNIASGLDDLRSAILKSKPKVVIGLGNTALWALTGEEGIGKWRGSMMELTISNHTFMFIPTYSAGAILRVWSWRFIMLQDIKRAIGYLKSPVPRPVNKFQIKPSFEGVMQTLNFLIDWAEHGELNLACDIETRFHKYISCIGVAWSNTEALCIPIMSKHNPKGYWAREEELAIVLKLKVLLTNPNTKVIGQNFVYDMQYIARHWGFVPNLVHDTMLEHHVCFAGLPKGLDYISSLYCAYHVYWKDEGKEYDPRKHDEEQYWIYNCKDCCATYEASTEIQKTLASFNLLDQAKFQLKINQVVFTMMLRGIKIDLDLKAQLGLELVEQIIQRQDFLTSTLGEAINPRSSKQLQTLFYGRFNVKPTISRKTGNPTLDKEALAKLKTKCDVLLHPIIDAILQIRRLGVFNSTFVRASLDQDLRMRCSYKVAGTETYRFASSEDAFGKGTNLQNIPKGNEDD